MDGVARPFVDWTERHRPRSLDDLVGNGPAVAAIRKWADAWAKGKPGKRAIILAGPPGPGKTSAALALANDMGWAPLELNASDARNAEAIERVAGAGSRNQTFGGDGAFGQGGHKLIILDEADNLTESLRGENAAGGGADLSDKGGKAAILKTIRATQQPIILIVNDLYALQRGSGAALRGLADTIKFSRVNVRSIPKALAGVAKAESIAVDREVLEAIAGRAGGDLRAAVRDLESISRGRTQVTAADLASLGDRDSTGTMFDLVRHVLKGRDLTALRREAMDVDATPDDIALWVDENLPKEFVHPEDLVAGYDLLSRADRFLGRTRRTQNYRLWAYASGLATGVAAVRKHPGPRKFTPFGFPQYLSKMGRTKAHRAAMNDLAEAVGRYTHASKRKTRTEQLPSVAALFQTDQEFAIYATAQLQLTEDHVVWLLGPDATAKELKAILEGAKELQEAAKAASMERMKAAAKGHGALDAFAEPDEGAVSAASGQGKEDDKTQKPAPSQGQRTLF